MSRPIILISAGRRNLPARDMETQTVLVGCSADYVWSVQRSGGVALMLPYLADSNSVYAALDAADGLMLTGGGDISPQLYGEEPHPAVKFQDPVRDEMEMELVREAVGRGMPVLGICRGIQIINVALGGTLIQDIPTQVENHVLHFGRGIAPVLLHSIAIEQDSLLAHVLGTTGTHVNSYHHQAVAKPGDGLTVTARASDGVIEAVESSEGRSILAVQCHPEEIAAPYPIFQRIFDWLVECSVHPCKHDHGSASH